MSSFSSTCACVETVLSVQLAVAGRLLQPDPRLLSFLKRARLILGAAIAAMAWWQGAVLGIAAEPAKKLHLMYLVTTKADDLKPGSVVAVESAFFTDGERIVFAYDYCRAYRAFINGVLEENQPLLALKKQKKLAGDLPSLELWCRRHDPKLEPSWSIRDEGNEPFNAEVNSMVGMDNEGAKIRLSSLEFVNYHKAGRGILTQIVPPKNGSAIPPGRRQYRFFLMSSNLQALKTILPVWRVKNKQSQALFNRLDSIIGKFPDSIRPLCGSGSNALYWCEARSIAVFDLPEVKILSALLAKDDLDVDVILAVGLQTSVPLGDAARTQVLWRGLNFLFASGPNWVRADAMKV